MQPRVLIVGQIPDPHIQAVTHALQSLGAQSVVFNRLEPHLQSVNFSLSAGERRGWLCSAGQRWDLESFTGVWWRMKPYTVAEQIGAPLPLPAAFMDREWRSALDSLPAFTLQARWINPRPFDWTVRNKPLQLAAALQAGFTIPHTLVSNDPYRVGEFLAAPEREYIYKPLTWYIEPPDKLLFTSLVGAQQVQAGDAELQVAPGIFQERIPKAYELRVTLVGEQIFAASIASQAQAGTQLDWRHDQYNLEYQAVELEPAIIEKLLKVQQNLGLAFGAYDLVVTPAGETVFLEVNPLGQWLWIEKKTGLAISQALARELVG